MSNDINHPESQIQSNQQMEMKKECRFRRNARSPRKPN